MKKLIIAAILSVSAISHAAIAESKIAILDAQMAIKESNVAVNVKADIEKIVSADQQKMESIKSSMQMLLEKLNKEALVLSDEEKFKLQSQIKGLEEEGKFFQQRVQTAVREQEELFFRKVGPKVEDIARDIAKSEGYDIVLPRGAVLYFDPKFDITKKVIKELNKSGI